MNKEEVIKKLQELFSWSEFYSKNQRWDDYNKCELQVIEFKNKHKLD
jgi:hypothetical protein